jgi:uncharacterized protein
LTKAPMWISRGRVARNRSVRRIRSTRHDITIAGLPPALEGLRITHLSDLHVGELLGPAAIPGIVAQANGLGGDLIVLTGDFVDFSLSVLDPMIDALRKLHAPMGVFMVPGNHDYLEDGPQLLRRFRQAHFKMLVNESAVVMHKKCRVLIAGVDFAQKHDKLSRMVHRTLLKAPKDSPIDLRLLLAHHPDAFDAACRHSVHLTLSGHTHGGQLALSSKRGRKGSIGLGSLAFQYPRGLYQRDGCYLHVTSGVGSWFPWRIRCPAEIALLTLRAGNGTLPE